MAFGICDRIRNGLSGGNGPSESRLWSFLGSRSIPLLLNVFVHYILFNALRLFSYTSTEVRNVMPTDTFMPLRASTGDSQTMHQSHRKEALHIDRTVPYHAISQPGP
jgi:hypothetical protein